MKKKLVALLLVAVMTIAAAVIPAAAANYDGIDYSAVKGANLYVNSYDNLTLCVQGEAGDPGLLGADHVADAYGLIVFCTPESTGNLHLAINAENNGWNSDVASEPVAFDGGVYYARVETASPFVNGESYSQYKDGNYVAKDGTVPATSPLAGASLPKTGVVSAAVLYAIGSALVGAGVVVTKKSRNED